MTEWAGSLRPELTQGFTTLKVSGESLSATQTNYLNEYGGFVRSLEDIMRPALRTGGTYLASSGTMPSSREYLEEYGGHVHNISQVLRPGLAKDVTSEEVLLDHSPRHFLAPCAVPAGTVPPTGLTRRRANSCPKPKVNMPEPERQTARNASPERLRTRAPSGRAEVERMLSSRRLTPARSSSVTGTPNTTSTGNASPRTPAPPCRSARKYSPGLPSHLSCSKKSHKALTWARRYQILESAIQDHISRWHELNRGTMGKVMPEPVSSVGSRSTVT